MPEWGVTVLGWVAATVGTSSSLPQLIRILRTHTTAGVSLILWQIQFATGLAWAFHGIWRNAANLIYPNFVSASLALTVLILLRQDRRLGWLRCLLPPLVLGVTGGCLDLLISDTAFGLLMLAPALVGQYTQAVNLLQRSDIRGLSIGYLILNLSLQTLWVTWSFFSGDLAVTWCGILSGVAVSVNITLYILRRGGVLKARPLGAAKREVVASATDADVR